MGHDVTCPYCRAEQEINHDDGYGYEEGEDYTQECVECEKEFHFSTHVHLSYDVFCAADKHDMEPAGAQWPGLWECLNCDYYEMRD